MVRGSTVLGFGIAALASAPLAGSAHAAFTFDDITFWAGSGANEAALVVDFNDGKSPASHAWGFRWDGDATVTDLFAAVVTADARLFAKVGPAGTFGTPVYGIGYDLDNDGVFGVDDGSTFGAGGIKLTSDLDADGAAATDADDHYEEGWFSDGFWTHFVGSGEPFNGGNWLGGNGLDSTPLTDGAWQGLSFDPAYSFTDAPSEPLPEPTTLALIALGGAALLRRR